MLRTVFYIHFLPAWKKSKWVGDREEGKKGGELGREGSSENGGRNAKIPALTAGAPFPFPCFRAFLPPFSPFPFCPCHAG